MSFFYGWLRQLKVWSKEDDATLFITLLKLKAFVVGARVEVGDGLVVGRNVRVHLVRNGTLKIGRNVTLGEYSRLVVGNGGLLKIGDGCSFTGFDFVYANKRIVFGMDCAVAPLVVITDANHSREPGKRLIDSVCSYSPVEVGENVWLGAGAIVLAGRKVGRNATVGAGVVVTRNVEDDEVFVGGCK